MQKIEYPENCHEFVKEFIDRINNMFASEKAVVLDSYYFSQNGSNIAIYKIAIAPLDILTFKREFIIDNVNTELSTDNTEIKWVKYNKFYHPYITDVYFSMNTVENEVNLFFARMD